MTCRAFLVVGALALVLAAFQTGAPQTGDNTRLDWSVEFCQVTVPSILVQGSASFPITVEFEVRASTVRDIRVVDNPVGLDASEVIACVSRWVMSGQPDGSVGRATFHWSHGVGWQRLGLSIGAIHQVISITGNRCVYR